MTCRSVTKRFINLNFIKFFKIKVNYICVKEYVYMYDLDLIGYNLWKATL